MAVLLSVRSLVDDSAPGFDELLDEGGAQRWSLAYLRSWIDHRRSRSIKGVLGDLVDGLILQHRRIALGKVGVFDTRDPFCIAEDNGLLSFVRTDQPFWTGGACWA